MKKLNRKGVVHPTPPLISDHLLYLLPTTLLTLTTSLSPEECEVLAYLISCSSSSNKITCVDHPPCFDCCCFFCYTCYWAKWDSSPNRQLIHEIIDVFEDGLLNDNKKQKVNKKKKNKGKGRVCKEKVSVELDEVKKCDVGLAQTHFNNNVVEEMEKGSISRFVSFVGERIWSVWN